MSTPRYVPRSFCEQPQDYGKRDAISWKKLKKNDPMTTRAQYSASIHQHGQIVRLRRGLKELGISTAEYATKAGSSYDRMAKMLRGVAVMHLEDVAMADLLVHRHLRDRKSGS